MVKKNVKRRDFKPRIDERKTSVIFLAENKRAYKVDLNVMVQTQFQAEKLSDRRVIRKSVKPPVFMWEITPKKFTAYSPHISRLCEEVWQGIRNEIKRKKTSEDDAFYVTEERLEQVEAAIANGTNLEIVSLEILRFSYHENTLRMLSLMKGYPFNVEHIRTCLIENVDIEIVRTLVVDHGVELCGQILFPHNSSYYLNSSAIRKNLPSLKFLLSFGCNFSENCWKTGSQFIKKLSRECFHQFLFRYCRKLKFGNDINTLIVDYYLSVKIKDISHNLYKTKKLKARKTPPSRPIPSMKENSPLILGMSNPSSARELEFTLQNDNSKNGKNIDALGSFDPKLPPATLLSLVGNWENSSDSSSSSEFPQKEPGKGKKRNSHKVKMMNRKEQKRKLQAEKKLAKQRKKEAGLKRRQVTEADKMQRKVEGLKRREAKALAIQRSLSIGNPANYPGQNGKMPRNF